MAKKSDNLISQDLNSQALSIIDSVPEVYTEEMFDSLVRSNSYLPRVQLFTFKSDSCAQGKVEPNTYGLVSGKNIVPLGKEVKCIIVTWRSKAMDLSDKEKIINCYSQDNDVFKNIVARSAEQNSGCMYGPEFLIYLPEQNEYATLFLGSKSARNESTSFRERIKQGAKLGSRLAENKKFKWQVPTCSPCTEDLKQPEDKELFDEVVEQFLHPKETELELAAEVKER